MAARLEITFEPEALTFRDEGGRFNYLCAYFVLRAGMQGLPQALEDAAATHDGRVPLDCALVFEDGSDVPNKSGKPAVRILGLGGEDPANTNAAAAYGGANAGGGGQRQADDPAFCDVRTLRGSVRWKILKLSRNHDQKRFCLRISLAGVPWSAVAPVQTRPTMVLSKRKWLKADARVPEVSQRKSAEALAAVQNSQLALEAGSLRAKERIEQHVREIAALPAIEKMYPRLMGDRNGNLLPGEGIDSVSCSAPPSVVTPALSRFTDSGRSTSNSAASSAAAASASDASPTRVSERLQERLQERPRSYHMFTDSGARSQRRRPSMAGDTSSVVSDATAAAAGLNGDEGPEPQLLAEAMSASNSPALLPKLPPLQTTWSDASDLLLWPAVTASLGAAAQQQSWSSSSAAVAAAVTAAAEAAAGPTQPNGNEDDDDQEDDEGALRERLERYEQEAKAAKERLAALTEENKSLKRKLESSDSALPAPPPQQQAHEHEQQQEVATSSSDGSKRLKTEPQLPRTHSLGVIALDDDADGSSGAIEDWAAVFSAPRPH